MFENCSTLAELNAERAKLLKGDVSPDDLMFINNEFNKRRISVIKASQTFKQLTVTKARLERVNVHPCMHVSNINYEKFIMHVNGDVISFE